MMFHEKAYSYFFQFGDSALKDEAKKEKVDLLTKSVGIRENSLLFCYFFQGESVMILVH